jgi:FMN-dependent NADH-azoreductase
MQSSAQQVAVAKSDTYVGELLEADIIVIASAMINFSLSSPLKSWIDHVMRAGVTFQYSESGPKGLATGKKAYLVLARGGIYSDGPMKPLDFQAPYLKTTLGIIGITDVQSVLIEGVAYGPVDCRKGRQSSAIEPFRSGIAPIRSSQRYVIGTIKSHRIWLGEAKAFRDSAERADFAIEEERGLTAFTLIELG